MKNEPDSDIEIEFLGRNQGEKRIWDVDAEPDPPRRFQDRRERIRSTSTVAAPVNRDTSFGSVRPGPLLNACPGPSPHPKLPPKPKFPSKPPPNATASSSAKTLDDIAMNADHYIPLNLALRDGPALSRSPKKRPRPSRTDMDVVEILSSDEDKLLLKTGPPKRSPVKPKKKHKVAPEDSDSDWAHAGYDIHDDSIWKEDLIVEHPKFGVDMDDEPLEQEELEYHLPKERGERRPFAMQESVMELQAGDLSMLDWNLVSAQIQRHLGKRKKRKPLSNELGYNRTMKFAQKQTQAPASVNKIALHGDHAAIASCAVGGGIGPDAPPGMIAYNCAGTLRIWKDGYFTTIPGHIFPGRPFYYTVKDVVFDPLDPDFIYSIGLDRYMQLWNASTFFDDPSVPPDEPKNPSDPKNSSVPMIHYRRYNEQPEELQFNPGNLETFAVSCNDATCYIYRDMVSWKENENSKTLRLVPPRNPPHQSTAINWGQQATKNCLYSCTSALSPEKVPAQCQEGYHKAWDTHIGEELYQFDLQQAADSMNISNDGESVAITTATSSGADYLYIFDVRRQDGKPTSRVLLEDPNFPRNHPNSTKPLETSCICFNSDGTYVALARNDNSAHVYDVRYLDKPVVTYTHHTAKYLFGEVELFGITEISWATTQNGRREGLITGGEDGCVRLWDTSHAQSMYNDGEVLGKMDSAVAYFAVGDRSRHEVPLMIGDNTGHVAVYDATLQDPGPY